MLDHLFDSFYNLTIMTLKQSYCAILVKCMSGRAGNDIASAFMQILNNVYYFLTVKIKVWRKSKTLGAITVLERLMLELELELECFISCWQNRRKKIKLLNAYLFNPFLCQKWSILILIRVPLWFWSFVVFTFLQVKSNLGTNI